MSDIDANATPAWKRKTVWRRGLWMLLTGVLVWAAQVVLQVVTVLQFVLMLADNGRANTRIAAFGKSLGAWLHKAALFQTGQSEDRPWPWAPLD